MPLKGGLEHFPAYVLARRVHVWGHRRLCCRCSARSGCTHLCTYTGSVF